MLSAEHIYQLPLELRIYIANMNVDAYIRMYIYDAEFRKYFDIDYFINRFVSTKLCDGMKYTIFNTVFYIYHNGNEVWYKNNLVHRENGPAIIHNDYCEQYLYNGNLHRTDGPAMIRYDGHQAYYYHGKLHRDNGPAVINPNGVLKYYNDGELYDEFYPANAIRRW